ncbi:DUF4239 domain-containing protein [Kitasatospora putterlickiae]|uniref:DUF4239 domain-containing protein n=2 Tax=Kitasatospora putterlickiae TaxID=221725 RepID=A0ABN1Y5Z9_9ACTN
MVGSLAIAAAVLILLPHFVPTTTRKQHNDVTAAIFAMVGVLYAVLLAFVVIVVWEAADDARATTFREADQLAGLYWTSRQFDSPAGVELTDLTLQYAHTVIGDEWRLMADHRTDPNTTGLVYRIRDTTNTLQPADSRQQAHFENALKHVEGLASERRARLTQVQDAVPPLLWVPLIAGAVLTVGFTFVFGISSIRLHLAMVLTMTAMICVVLIVIKEMNYPFDGVNAVEPDAFQVFLNRLPTTR